MRIPLARAAERLGVSRGYLSQHLAKKLGLEIFRDDNAKDREGRMRAFLDEDAVEQAALTYHRERPRSKRVSIPDEHQLSWQRGWVAGECFRILTEGGTYADCVMKTNADPRWVQEFFELFHMSDEERMIAVRALNELDHSTERLKAREDADLRRLALENKENIDRAKRHEEHLKAIREGRDEPTPPKAA